MTQEFVQVPRKIETTVEGRCSHCKEIIYREMIVEEQMPGNKIKETRRVLDNREEHTCRS